VWRELSNVEDPVSSESGDGDPSLALLDVMTNLATYHLQRPFYADDHASLGVHLDAFRESLDIPWQRPSWIRNEPRQILRVFLSWTL
jgi:hypothetical protein